MPTTARTSHNAAPVKDLLVSLQYVSTSDSPHSFHRLYADPQKFEFFPAQACSRFRLDVLLIASLVP